MAVLVVAAAGAYVGAAVGIGAAAGWVIGSFLYSSFLAPGQKKNVRTSELNDLRVMGTEYGQPIPYIIGTMAVAGDMWWNSDRRPVVTTTTTESGGKDGGGGTETTTTVTTYDMDALIGLCDNRIVGVMRIWDEGKLVWSAHPDSPPESIEASAETITWDRMTIYTGDPSQMPDPTYEAAVGIGSAPAYRHRAYVFFEGLHLGQSGRVPNFTFEIVTDGGAGAQVGPWIEVGQLNSKLGTTTQQPHDGISDGTYVHMPHGGYYINRITLPGLATTDWLDVHSNYADMDTGFIEQGDGILVASSLSGTMQWSEDQGATWAAGPTFAGASEHWCLAYGDGNFISLAREIQTGVPNYRLSTNGKTWIVSSVEDNGWADIAWGGGWFVAVARDPAKPHQVMRSDDAGTSWQYVTPPTGTWNRIVYSGDGHFVALMAGDNIAIPAAMNGAVMTSNDYGATWTLRNASHSRVWCALATNGNGIVVAVANSFDAATVDSSMASFDHGETWEVVPLALPMRFNGITWGKNGYFYAQAENRQSFGFPGGTRNWGMVLGASGGTVTSETVSLQETVRRLLVRCGMVEGTQFDVSALDDSGGSAGGGYEISPWIEVGELAGPMGNAAHGVSDGTYVYQPRAGNFVTRITLPGLATTDWVDYAGISDNLTGADIAYGTDENVVVTAAFYTSGGGWHDFIQWSHNQGVTWTKGTTFGLGDQIFERWWLAYGDGTFVAVCNYATVKPFPNVRTSADGQTWGTLPNANYYGWTDLAFGDGWFVAVSHNWVMRSNNGGTSWQYIGVPGGTWNRLVHSGGGHFVALMDGFDAAGTPQQNGAVMTSSDHGATWTLRNASHARSWCALATNGDGVVVAVANSINRAPMVDGSMASHDHGETWELVPLALNMRFDGITYGGNNYFYAQARNMLATDHNWGMVLGARRLAPPMRPVRALYVSQVSPTRQTIDALASTYFFDMVVSDKLYFRPRGGAIAATIPYEDLGAAFDGSSDELDQFILKNSGDLEFPARVSLVYRNVMHEYQVDTQTSDRLVSASADTAKVITLPLCMTPGEAKQCADVMLFNQAVNMLAVDSIKVLGDYVRLEPTDPVTVFDAQGNSYRMRLTSRRDEYPLLEYSAVLDDVAVLTSSGVTDENYEESFIVEAVPLTVDLLLDIPMLRDADTDLGMYAVAKGATGAKWPGCVIYVSGDGVNYDSVGAIAYPNIFGVCQTTLGNWPRGRLIDEANRVTVNVGPGASLSSSTYERVLNNEAINACVIGDEVLQFIDATATADGVYVLSRLLRGSQGTERVMGTHGAGERFALLDPGRLGRVATPNNLLGVPLDYKFVTIGKSLESDAPESVANTGVNLKPISPVYLQVYRDPATNDATITWERRSRFAVRVLGPAGIDVPPDEVGWEVDVYSSGTYATRVRTITATVAARPSAHYYAAEQSADGLTPGAPLFLRIYPMSGAVGRGFPLTASM